MKSISTALSNHFDGAVTTIANAWKVTRRDGVVMGFTDHDRSQVIEGVNYIASSGYFRSAISNSATTAVDNLEVQGFLDDEMISEDDLRNGAYDFAEVEIFAYNWADLTMGILRLRYGYFGEVKLRPSGLFVVELRGLLQLFSQTVGETISPDCRADLGDRRCKVKLLPELRASVKAYAEGDRVLIPDSNEVRAVSLQLLNNSFEWYETTNYLGIWFSSNAYITNYPGKPMDGTIYFLRPTSQAGTMVRVMPRDFGPSVGEESVGASWYTRCPEEGWQVGVLVEWVMREGLLGLSTTVLSTYEIPYQDVPVSEGWTFNSGSEEMIIPECNGCRITIRFRRNPSDDYEHLEGSVCKAEVARVNFYNFEDEYMEFTIPDPATKPMKVWDNGFPVDLEQTHAGNINLQPVHGYGMFHRQIWTNGDSGQSVALTNTAADLTAVDSEKYTLKVKYLIGASEWGYTGGIRALFYTSTGTLIKSVSTGQLDIKPFGNWFERELESLVPENTRHIRIELFAGTAEERFGDQTSPKVFFDYIDANLHHEDSDTDNLLQYGGLEYVALTEGTTGETTPEVTFTPDEEVVDGTVTWKAVPPLYTFTSTISVVDSNREFYCPDIDAPDNWFTWGVLTFIDGSNARRGVEVLTWDNTTKKMVIMLPALTPIEVGTKIRVHAGCDKTRAITGCKKFNNILNYRGEPEVPGTDQYFKVGGTGR